VSWVAWRQARAATIAVAGVLVVYIGLSTWERLTNGHLTGMTQSLSAYLYLFLGLFLGAPLVAREYDTGTHQLAWTQSVTRSRWLTGRLVVNGTVALAATAVLHLLVNASGSRPYAVDGVEAAYLVTHGFLPYAEALCAVAVGTVAGAAVGRLLPALGVTLVAWVAMFQALSTGGGVVAFWPSQLTRGAALLVVTAGLVALTYRLVGRRS
jgi:ABC-type transport system involved in multi-copper enzyme maturation permease subunit